MATNRISSLTQERCVPCRRDSPRLNPEEIAALLPQLPGWDLVDADGAPRLVRTFRLPSYAAALALTQRLGELAEAEGHHPAILLEWRQVTVSWWTHAIGGLHRNDAVMAAKTDIVVAEWDGDRKDAPSVPIAKPERTQPR